MTAETSLVVGDLDISKLSDEELFQQLSALGETVGPIIGTTRKVYQRRLAGKLGANLSSSSFIETADPESEEELEDVAPSQAYIDRLSSGFVRQRKPISSASFVDDEDDESECLEQDSVDFTPSPRAPVRSADSSHTSQRFLDESYRSNTSCPLIEEQPAPPMDVIGLLFKALVVTVFCALFFFVFINGNSGDEFSRLEHLAKSASEALNANKKPSALPK